MYLLSFPSLVTLAVLAGAFTAPQAALPAAQVGPGAHQHAGSRTAVGSSCQQFDFEGLADSAPIGTLPGSPSATFGPSWFAQVDLDDGGSGNFANEPSPVTVAIPFAPGGPIDFSVPVWYVEIHYSAAASALPLTLTAYNGSGGTGVVVGSSVGTTLGTDFQGANCSGDPNGNFCLWDVLSFMGPSDDVSSLRISAAGGSLEYAIDNLLVCGSSPANTFCGQSKPTSVFGCSAVLLVFDATLATGSWKASYIPRSGTLAAPGTTVGLYIYDYAHTGQSAYVATTPFGKLCLSGFRRSSPVCAPTFTGHPTWVPGAGACTTDAASLEVDCNAGALGISVGDDVNVQFWYRDPTAARPGSANLSNAVFYTVR